MNHIEQNLLNEVYKSLNPKKIFGFIVFEKPNNDNIYEAYINLGNYYTHNNKKKAFLAYKDAYSYAKCNYYMKNSLQCMINTCDHDIEEKKKLVEDLRLLYLYDDDIFNYVKYSYELISLYKINPQDDEHTSGDNEHTIKIYNSIIQCTQKKNISKLIDCVVQVGRYYTLIDYDLFLLLDNYKYIATNQIINQTRYLYNTDECDINYISCMILNDDIPAAYKYVDFLLSCLSSSKYDEYKNILDSIQTKDEMLFTKSLQRISWSKPLHDSSIHLLHKIKYKFFIDDLNDLC